ncbi:MAG: hypothetical protein CMP30_11675 [Roseibacillus sp.]|nr:hypothetical protein [Roseibacillus sp.]
MEPPHLPGIQADSNPCCKPASSSIAFSDTPCGQKHPPHRIALPTGEETPDQLGYFLGTLTIAERTEL